MVLVAVDRTLCTASVSDENIIILCKKDTLLYTFYLAFDSSGDLFAIFKIKDHVCDLSIKLEVNTCILQIFFHGKNQGFVLVVLGEFQGAEIPEDRITEQVNMIDGLEKTGYLVLGILDFANQEHVPLKFLARLLERQSWKMKPFLYENHICLLKYSKTAIHQNLSFDEKELHILEQLLEQYEYRIGVSNIFTELKRMKDAYAQAVFTLQWNQKTEQNTEVLCQYKMW